MASEEDSFNTITFKGTPVNDLKVTDIKRELEKRGLSKSGSKTQLTDRLKAQLLLEKLQQDAAQSSGDELSEGKVPNMALQQDNKAGQSEFVRQYLEQQQRNLEIQMEVKKQVEEERKRKSADESSADESNSKPIPIGSQASSNPDVTTPKKFKDDSCNAPAKEGTKMPRPARKSSRNASKGENGQEGEAVKESSPIPDNDRLRERTRSGSSSSSRSPTPDKASRGRRGRPTRGRARRGAGGRRGAHQTRKESRSSSPSSSPEEMPKKRQRRSTNSISSRSRSRSPQMVSPDAPTRRSSRRASAALKSTPDHSLEEEPPDDVDKGKNESTEDLVSTPPKRNLRNRTSSETRSDANLIKTPETSTDKIEAPKESPSKSEASEAKKVSITATPENSKTVEKISASAEVIDKKEEVAASESSRNTPSSAVESQTPVTEAKEPPAVETKQIEQPDSGGDKDSLKVQEKPAGQRLSRWKSSRAKPPHQNKTDAPEQQEPEAQIPVLASPEASTGKGTSQREERVIQSQENKPSSPKAASPGNVIPPPETSTSQADKTAAENQKTELTQIKTTSESVSPKLKEERLTETVLEKQNNPISADTREVVSEPKPDIQTGKQISPENLSSQKEIQRKKPSSRGSSSSRSRSRSKSPKKQKRSSSSSSSSSQSKSRSRSRSSSSGSSTDVKPAKSSVINKVEAKPRPARSLSPSPSPQRIIEASKVEIGNKSTSVPETGDDDQRIVETSSKDPQPGDDSQKEPGLGRRHEDRKAGQTPESKEKQEVTSGGDAAAGKEKDFAEQSKVVENKDNNEADEDMKTKKDKGTKKRKWGSKTSKAGKTTKRTTSMEISSDSLKNLIGEVKLSETVFDMETEMNNTLDYEPEEDRRDVKVKRTVVQSPHAEEEAGDTEDARKVEVDDREEESPEQEETPAEPEKKVIRLSAAAPKEGGKKKVKEGKKVKKKKEEAQVEEKENKSENKEKIFATTRPTKPLLPAVDEPEPVSGNQSPARHPPSRVVRIAGLMRPFTVGQLKELLRRTGELDEDYFWINDIKSHCLTAFKTEEDAVKTRAALHGSRWPQSNPKILIVDFATIEDVEHRKAGGDAPLPALAQKPKEDPKKLREQKEEEEKERRLKARQQRDKEREEREKEGQDKRDGRDRDRKKDADRKNPVREWDRDKVQQLSRSRSRSKERERPARRSRSRDRDQRKRRDQSRDKKDEDRKKDRKQKDAKADEEPPAKLLDDLFRKTKATPCIYWLPLTEEQAQQRQVKRQEQEKERQKRLAAAEEREKEELKRREAARLERQRERERVRERSRDRDRDRGRQDRGKASRSRSRSRSRRRR